MIQFLNQLAWLNNFIYTSIKDGGSETTGSKNNIQIKTKHRSYKLEHTRHLDGDGLITNGKFKLAKIPIMMVMNILMISSKEVTLVITRWLFMLLGEENGWGAV